LYPDTKPDLHFDETGQCSACRNYANRPNIDWYERLLDLQRLLDRFHGECIVPSSGGKDSTAQVMKLLDLGADVTVVTARTCHLTPIGRRNIDNLSRHAKTIEVVPNMSDRKVLNRRGLELVGDISWPEHVAIFTTPFRVSLEIDVPLIMYGECPQAEYGGPMGSEQARQMTSRWRDEFGGFLGLRTTDFGDLDMTWYTMPHDIGNTEAHFLGAYMPWDSHANAMVAKNAGMEFWHGPPSPANWWEFENLDNYQTGIHDMFLYLKYGYTRLDAQLSVDVRRGLVTLDEARAASLHQYPIIDDYLGVSIVDIVENIGMSMEQFGHIMRQFNAGKANHSANALPRTGAV